MPSKKLIIDHCREMQRQCTRLDLYYHHVEQRTELGADTTGTMTILTEILDGINSDTVKLRKLLEPDDV